MYSAAVTGEDQSMAIDIAVANKVAVVIVRIWCIFFGLELVDGIGTEFAPLDLACDLDLNALDDL